MIRARSRLRFPFGKHLFLYWCQGCTGQPFFASGQGGAEEKIWGGAGRGRAGSKILVAGRGQSNPTRAFSGWDKKTVNR